MTPNLVWNPGTGTYVPAGSGGGSSSGSSSGSSGNQQPSNQKPSNTGSSSGSSSGGSGNQQPSNNPSNNTSPNQNNNQGGNKGSSGGSGNTVIDINPQPSNVDASFGLRAVGGYCVYNRMDRTSSCSPFRYENTKDFTMNLGPDTNTSGGSGGSSSYTNTSGGSSGGSGNKVTITDVKNYNDTIKNIADINSMTRDEKVQYLMTHYNPEIASKVNAYSRALGTGDLYDAVVLGNVTSPEAVRIVKMGIENSLNTWGQNAAIVPTKDGGSRIVESKYIVGGGGSGGSSGGGSSGRPSYNYTPVDWQQVSQTAQTNLENIQNIKTTYETVTGKSADNVSLEDLGKFYTAYNMLAYYNNPSFIKDVTDPKVREYAAQIYQYANLDNYYRMNERAIAAGERLKNTNVTYSDGFVSPFSTNLSVTATGLPNVPMNNVTLNVTRPVNKSGADLVLESVLPVGMGLYDYSDKKITNTSYDDRRFLTTTVDTSLSLSNPSKLTVNEIINRQISSLSIATIEDYLKNRGGIVTLSIPVEKLTDEEVQRIAYSKGVSFSDIKKSGRVTVEVDLNRAVNSVTGETYAEYLIARRGAEEKAAYVLSRNEGLLETAAYNAFVTVPELAKSDGGYRVFERFMSIPIFIDMPYKLETFVTGKSKELATGRTSLSAVSDYALGSVDVGLSIVSGEALGSVVKAGTKGAVAAAKDVTYYLNFPVIGTVTELSGRYAISNFKTLKPVGEALVKAGGLIKPVEVGAQSLGWFTYAADRIFDKELGPLSQMTEAKMQEVKTVFSLSDTSVPYVEKGNILTGLTIANVPYYAARVLGTRVGSNSRLAKPALETAYYTANVIAIGSLASEAADKERGDLARTYGRTAGSVGFIEFWLEGQTIDRVFETSGIYRNAEAVLKENVAQGKIRPDEYNLRITKLTDVTEQPFVTKATITDLKATKVIKTDSGADIYTMDIKFPQGINVDAEFADESVTFYKPGVKSASGNEYNVYTFKPSGGDVEVKPSGSDGKQQKYFKGGLRPFAFTIDIKGSGEDYVNKMSTKSTDLKLVTVDIRNDVKNLVSYDVRQDLRLDVKQDVRLDTRTNSLEVVKPDIRLDLRPDVRLDTRDLTKIDLRPLPDIKPIDLRLDLRNTDMRLIEPKIDLRLDLRQDYRYDLREDLRLDVLGIPGLPFFGIFGGGGSGGRGSLGSGDNRSRKYKPSVGAGVLNIRSAFVDVDTTGLELRPILGINQRRRR